MRRVVITGAGAITPIGGDLDTIEHRLYNSISGLKWNDSHNTVSGSVDENIDSMFSSSDINLTDRVTKLSWVSYERSRKDSGIVPEGIFYGVGFGGALTVEECYSNISNGKKINPISIIKAMPNQGASYISLREKITGPCITYTTACSSSAVALGEAYLRIKSGVLKSAVAVGSECLNTKLNASWWRGIGAINEDKEYSFKAVRPYSADRKGTAISEGSVSLILEDLEHALARKAKIYCEITGYGLSSGTETFTKPCRSSQAQVMKECLKDLNTEDISYINSHGTGTPVGDLIELQAIEEVFGKGVVNIPISSTKSLTGHLLGAAGTFETLACIFVIKNNRIIPNNFINELDADISRNIFLPTIPEYTPINTVLNNSFAFGGTNVCIGLKKWK